MLTCVFSRTFASGSRSYYNGSAFKVSTVQSRFFASSCDLFASSACVCCCAMRCLQGLQSLGGCGRQAPLQSRNVHRRVYSLERRRRDGDDNGLCVPSKSSLLSKTCNNVLLNDTVSNKLTVVLCRCGAGRQLAISRWGGAAWVQHADWL